MTEPSQRLVEKADLSSTIQQGALLEMLDDTHGFLFLFSGHAGFLLLRKKKRGPGFPERRKSDKPHGESTTHTAAREDNV